MNQETVESMVTHLVQCSCNGFSDYPKHNEKVPEEVPFKQIAYNEEDQSGTPMKWNTIFKDLLSRCPQLCRDELVLPKPVSTARWRERNSREVLAPLGLKPNSENIIAGSLDMSRKRKAETSIWTPPTKRLKVDDESAKPCSIRIKKAPLKILLLEYKCRNNRSFVKLFDIIKEIPQVKEEVKPVPQNEFMNFLGLANQESPFNNPSSEIKTSHPTKLLSHPQIPFSSDYGQRLITRERHYLPQEVALRKIERTEWYLKGTTAPGIKNNFLPDIPYDYRKLKYLHKFNFPKRQYHQNHQPLEQAFMKYLCKPASLHIDMLDLSRVLAKKEEEEVAIINNESNEVVVINNEPNQVVVEESNEVVVINDDSNEVVAINEDSNEVVVINKDSNEVVVINEDSNEVVVINEDSNEVVVINDDSNEVVVAINDESNEEAACEEEEILTPNLLPEESNEVVLSMESEKLSDDCGSEMNQQTLESDSTCSSNTPKLISEPRRSIRLNYTKS